MKKFKNLWALWFLFLSVFTVWILYFGPRGKSVRNSSSAGRTIVAFGDAYTKGDGATSGDKTYPAVLSKLLGRPIANVSFSKLTTYEAIEKVDQNVIPLHPDLVIITLGLDDQRDAIPIETFTNNMGILTEKILNSGAMVVFVSLNNPDSGWRFKYLKRQNEDMGVLHIADAMEGIWTNKNWMATPQFPNDEGYQVLAQRVFAAINGYLVNK